MCQLKKITKKDFFVLYTQKIFTHFCSGVQKNIMENSLRIFFSKISVTPVKIFLKRQPPICYQLLLVIGNFYYSRFKVDFLMK